MTYFEPPRFGPRQPTEEQDREAAEQAAKIVIAAVRKLKEKNEVVRAKFKVDSITRGTTSRPTGEKTNTGHDVYGPAEIRTVKLSPVYGNGDPNHENTKFWNASPSGALELGCVNLAAAEKFELGKEYYVDFTPAN